MDAVIVADVEIVSALEKVYVVMVELMTNWSYVAVVIVLLAFVPPYSVIPDVSRTAGAVSLARRITFPVAALDALVVIVRLKLLKSSIPPA